MKNSTVDAAVLLIIQIEAMYGNSVTVSFIKKNTTLDEDVIRASLRRLEKKKAVWYVVDGWELRPEEK